MAKRVRRHRRRTGKLSGAARSAKSAPKHCKVQLSKCMRGRGSRSKASRCMKAFNRCKG